MWDIDRFWVSIDFGPIEFGEEASKMEFAFGSNFGRKIQKLNDVDEVHLAISFIADDFMNLLLSFVCLFLIN